MRHDKEVLLKGTAAVLAIAILMVFSAGDLWSKDRDRGAEVVVQRSDGTFLAGELLAAQGRTLVVSDRASARDVTIGIEDVRAIRIVRRANVLKRAMNGFLYGAVPVGGLALLGKGKVSGRLTAIAAFGGVGALIAAYRGASRGADRTAVLDGASAKRRDLALDRLRTLALFAGPLPADFDGVGRQPKLGTLLDTKDGRFEDLAAQRPPRFHLSFEPAYVMPRAGDAHIRLFKDMDFADTHPGGSFWFFEYGPTTYPQATNNTVLSLRSFTVEYSLNRSFAVGFAYSYFGETRAEGFRMIPVMFQGGSYYSELYTSATSAGDGYFLTASWKPVPDLFYNRYSFKLGVEMGLCASCATFGMNDGYGTSVSGRVLRRTVPAAGVVAGLDAYYGRNLSFGVWARYRFARASVASFSLDGSYLSLSEQTGEIALIDVPVTVAFPAHRIELGGLATGISFGLHF